MRSHKVVIRSAAVVATPLPDVVVGAVKVAIEMSEGDEQR
jgi:hypothetical protein